MENETQTVSRKHLKSNQHFKYQNIQKTNKKFLTMFIFQHSQLTQKEFEQ